jgi:hypothetical protein
MSSLSFSAIANSLQSRQRSIEHADRLMTNLVDESVPGLQPEDLARVARIREEFAALHNSATACFDSNRIALHGSRARSIESPAGSLTEAG